MFKILDARWTLKFTKARHQDDGKSIIRSLVEHVFADQKSQTGLFIRTVGITRTTMRIGVANIVYNMRCCLFLKRAQRKRVAIQRVIAPGLFKTQINSVLKNRQSNRQKLEITGQAYQSKVLRSLHLPEEIRAIAWKPEVRLC